MRMRKWQKAILAFGASVVLAVSAGIALRMQILAKGSTTAEPRGVFADEAIADCGRVQIPANEEINTNYDPLSGVVEVSYFDPSLGRDRKIYLRVDDPTCEQNPPLMKLVDSVVTVDNKVRAETCRSMEEAVRRGVSKVRGQPVDLEAAKRYLQRWCK